MNAALLSLLSVRTAAQMEPVESCGETFQAEPPADTARIQLVQIARVIEWARITASQRFAVKFSKERYCNGALFVVVEWRDAEAVPHSIGSVMLSGSASFIVGPRGGGFTVSDYRSGTSGKDHCLAMARHLARAFRGKLASHFN